MVKAGVEYQKTSTRRPGVYGLLDNDIQTCRNRRTPSGLRYAPLFCFYLRNISRCSGYARIAQQTHKSSDITSVIQLFLRLHHVVQLVTIFPARVMPAFNFFEYELAIHIEIYLKVCSYLNIPKSW